MIEGIEYDEHEPHKFMQQMKIYEDKIRPVNQPWLQLKLKKDKIDFLKECINIAKQTPVNMNGELAGNIHKSLKLKDKNDWFFKNVLLDLTERLFYENWDNYYKYQIVGKKLKSYAPPEFGMGKFWVNFQRETEFNPLHDHTGLYSFVIFIKIPTKYEEQHSIPFSANSNSASASDFEFVWSRKDTETCLTHRIPLSPEIEGRMLFFKTDLHHQVYPFYGTKEERITISGNIYFKKEVENLLPGNLQEEVNNYMEKHHGAN
jgi:hypothetical protein